ncbi:MAG: metallophosphoesterase [Chloroflexi bacterium]|nr:metallophosphoesterase [Chloroflexota bacterium]
MKILAISDTEIGFIYSPMIVDRFANIDVVISCGDLPYFYLEYIVSMLNVPLYYVKGNHASKVEFSSAGLEKTAPWGTVDLHQRTLTDEKGLLLTGLEGSARYNQGPYQYTQNQYWFKVFRLVPGLMINKLRSGRYLDVFVTHAPPWKIHDAEDPPHRGIKAFNWLIKVFNPQYHLHGHIHVYRKDTVMQTQVNETMVTNVYGYREITIEPFKARSTKKNIPEEDFEGSIK